MTIARISRIQPTYEELKHNLDILPADLDRRIQPTYEELKPTMLGGAERADKLYPAYL